MGLIGILVGKLLGNLFGSDSGDAPTPDPEEGSIVYMIPVGTYPVPQTERLTAGDEAGSWVYVVRDGEGKPIPFPEDATVIMTLRRVGQNSADISAPGVVEWGPGGAVKFTFSPTYPVPASGPAEASWKVNGLTFPIGRVIPVFIEDNLT